MGKKKAPGQGKIRTREHVIADLAVNHAERQVLLCGYTGQRTSQDYGIDMIVSTFNADGEQESGNIFLQVKGTERAQRLVSNQAVVFRVSRSDLQTWLAELLPVILIVYDAAADVAYWVHVQDYFRQLPGFNLFRAGKTVTMHLPGNQILNPVAVRGFAILRDHVYGQFRS